MATSSRSPVSDLGITDAEFREVLANFLFHQLAVEVMSDTAGGPICRGRNMNPAAEIAWSDHRWGIGVGSSLFVRLDTQNHLTLVADLPMNFTAVKVVGQH